MLRSAGRKSTLERRMEELRKESSLVRDDIRSLSKVLKSSDDHVSLPRLKSDRYTRAAVPPPTRKDPVAAPGPKTPGAVEEAARHGVLFGWASTAERRGAGASPRGTAAAAPEPANHVGPRNVPLAQNERFASYFSSGSFLGGKPLKRERSVQRNRAIVMLVAVLIFAFIVYNLLFR